MFDGLDLMARDMGREAAQVRMRSTIRVTRPPESDAPPVWEPDAPGGGDYVKPPPVVVYGPDVEPHHGMARCRMSNPSSSVLGGGTTLTLASVHVPHDVVFDVGDKVEVLISDNPRAVGITRTIRALSTGEQQTANRYGFEELGG